MVAARRSRSRRSTAVCSTARDTRFWSSIPSATRSSSGRSTSSPASMARLWTTAIWPSATSARSTKGCSNIIWSRSRRCPMPAARPGRSTCSTIGASATAPGATTPPTSWCSTLWRRRCGRCWMRRWPARATTRRGSPQCSASTCWIRRWAAATSRWRPWSISPAIWWTSECRPIHRATTAIRIWPTGSGAWRRAVSTASISTRWRWIWPSSRSGWPPPPRISR